MRGSVTANSLDHSKVFLRKQEQGRRVAPNHLTMRGSVTANSLDQYDKSKAEGSRPNLTMRGSVTANSLDQ